MKISQISNLPEDFCRDIYCEYEFYMDKQKYTTTVCQGKNTSPTLNYERQHHIDCVTKFLVDYLLEDKMTIKIYGTQELKRNKKPAAPKTAQVVTRPGGRPGGNTSGDNSKVPGVNSTMNSSVNSQMSAGNFKVVGQTVQSVAGKQGVAQNSSGANLMGVDPLRGMKGSYKGKPN